jgi:membrane protease YdiL (CAAX protease family)
MGLPALVAVRPDATSKNWVTILVAWAGTLALSRLPEIGLQEMLGIGSPPMYLIWALLGLGLVGIARIWHVARPLHGYFLVMLMIIATDYVLTLANEATDGLVRSAVIDLVLERIIVFLAAIGMIVILLTALHQKRSNIFLSVGDLRARTCIRLPAARRPLRWGVVGTIATVLLVAGFATQMWSITAFIAYGWSLIMLSPLVIASAALNAFGEEVIYRAAPLAFLHRVVGSGQAILITSVWFGLGHYYGGIPSGLSGAVEVGSLGLLLGAMMLGTPRARVAVDPPHGYRHGHLHLRSTGCVISALKGCMDKEKVMANIRVEDNNLVINIEGLDKLWTFTSRLEIPLTHVIGARQDPEVVHRWKGWRSRPGAHIPGVIVAGIFHRDGKRAFWDVHDPAKAVVIDLTDDRYGRLVVGVDDPAKTAAHIQDAIGT